MDVQELIEELRGMPLHYEVVFELECGREVKVAKAEDFETTERVLLTE